MRFIRQPGEALRPRAVVVPAMLHPVEFDLPVGVSMLEGIRAALAARGLRSGALKIEGGGFGPFGYVIPAVSPDATRAAWYSEARRPGGVSVLEDGAVTFGVRDGEPFFHCHAVWREADGQRKGGHALPEETVVARPVRVTGVGVSGADFAVGEDGETGFRLFGPVAGEPGPPGGRPGVLVRLKPNQDVTLALEAVARGAGFARPAVRGGVGSVIGARYEGGGVVEVPFTEMFVRRGGVGRGLAIAMVDVEDRVSEGVLVRGENPVLMTLECVLDPEGDVGHAAR